MDEKIEQTPQNPPLAQKKDSKLDLTPSDKYEDLLVGTRKDGKIYSVRKHRKNLIMPDMWLKTKEQMPTIPAKITAEGMEQIGCRISEGAQIEDRDCDYERNTIKLRVTKTKAKKKGEERGVPRTIPVNSEYMKRLKRHFKSLPPGSKIGFLSIPAFNIALKKAAKKAGLPDWYMYSSHSIRKMHGNWLKALGNAGLMKIDASEICLRLGHDYDTFLRDYGSANVMNYEDLMLIKKILGDLYARQDGM